MTDEMYSLLGRYFSGEATEEEQHRVLQWIEASEENRADFNVLEKLWNKSDGHEQINFDTDKAWTSVHARLQPARAVPVRRMRLFTRAIAVAASFILLLGVWWLYRNMFGDRTIVADVAMKEVRLEDGSMVYLRKGATLEFPRHFSNVRREVELTGEAFFDVSHDPSKPFVISAETARVEVVGTSFTVNTNNNAVELIVKTGRVRFGAAHEQDRNVLVSAGERATLTGNNLTKELNTDENFNAWQSKLLVFNNTPVPQVAATLSNYYNVRIGIKKEDAAQLSGVGLTARFHNQPLAAVLDEISLITSYRIQRVSDAEYEISLK